MLGEGVFTYNIIILNVCRTTRVKFDANDTNQRVEVILWQPIADGADSANQGPSITTTSAVFPGSLGFYGLAKEESSLRRLGACRFCEGVMTDFNELANKMQQMLGVRCRAAEFRMLLP